jgi:hypothetical protein
MGALVTISLAADSHLFELPWILTVGPLGDDEDWEPVVCGPYEREHALALGRAVAIEEDLMAVVEPIRPRLSAADIRRDIAAARAEAADPVARAEQWHGDTQISGDLTVEQVRNGFERIAKLLSVQ